MVLYCLAVRIGKSSKSSQLCKYSFYSGAETVPTDYDVMNFDEVLRKKDENHIHGKHRCTCFLPRPSTEKLNLKSLQPHRLATDHGVFQSLVPSNRNIPWRSQLDIVPIFYFHGQKNVDRTKYFLYSVLLSLYDILHLNILLTLDDILHPLERQLYMTAFSQF